jgi:hypothetical protein
VIDQLTKKGVSEIPDIVDGAVVVVKVHIRQNMYCFAGIVFDRVKK